MLLLAPIVLVAAASPQGQKLSGPMPVGIVGDVQTHRLSPDGQWLVYRADGDQDELFELYSVPVSGGAPVKLNGPLVAGGDVGGFPSTFEISPDSSRVVYAADQDTDNRVELYSAPIGGGSAVKLNLPTAVSIGAFAIAGDSSRVAFLIQGGDLYSVPLAGGVVTKLNPTLVVGGDVTLFAISPDSTRAVYRADQQTNNTFELYSVPLAGGAATKLNPALVANGNVFDGSVHFQVSADSSRVVYLADQVTDEVYELFSVPLGGGSATRLHPALVANGDAGAFAIAPDSSRVVYSADQDTNDQIELYGVPLAGGASVKLNASLIANGDVGLFRISPDSSRVVYEADQQSEDVNELYGVSLTGGAVVTLSPPLTLGGDVSPSPSALAISPDSTRVVFEADADVDTVVELFSAPLAGGAIVQLNPPLGATEDTDLFALTLDSALVLYVADQDVDGVNELFSVPLAGGAALQVSPPSLYLSTTFGLAVTPDSSTVVYQSDPDAPSVVQSYSSPVLGGAATKLSGALASVLAAGDVLQHGSSPDGKRVVYLADQDVDGVTELYSVPASGGPSVRLNAPLVGGGSVQKFAVAPDSARVLYLARQENSTRAELYSVPIDGGAVTKLSPPLPEGGSLFDFKVSSDGTMVVYLAIQDTTHRELYAVPITGGVSIHLNDPLGGLPPEQITRFEIAPDSSRVLYQRGFIDVSYSNPYIDLYSVPIAGGPVVQLCDAFHYCLSFHVTPDSSRVILTADLDTSGLYELYSVPLGGGAPVKLSPQLGGGSVPELIFCPVPSCFGSPPSFFDTWARISADSTRVVFTARASSGALRELYSAPIAGGAAVKLNVAPAGRNIVDVFEITADSSRVAYLGPRAGGSSDALYRVPIAGGASLELSGALVAGGSVVALAPSPDSGRVVFLADKDTNDVFELYSVALAGGTIAKLSPPLAPGRDVSFGFVLGADSRSVVFEVDGVGSDELFCTALDGSPGPGRLNRPVVAGGNIEAWSVTPDSRYALYRADQDRDETFELYGSLITRFARRSGPP